MTHPASRDVLSPVLERLPGAARRALARSPWATGALRDVAAMVRSWTTPRPPFQLIGRDGAALPGERRLKVLEVRRETPDAVSLFVERPAGVRELAGQFLTFTLSIDGAEVRRSYSLSSAPDEPCWRVTVKRVAGGSGSTHLTERVRAGDTLRTRGPSGDFTLDPDALPGHLLLIGGGSGVTPLFALAKAALTADAGARVTMLIGDRRGVDCLFAEEIDELARAHDGLRVVRVLESSGSVESPRRIDEADLDDALARGTLHEARVYVCGPEPLMDLVVHALGRRGVGGAQVKTERFVTVRAPAADRLPSTPVTLRVGGREAPVAPGQTLLEAATAAEIPLEFSCTMGGCGACVMRLVDGDVAMAEPNCLDDDERRRRLVLTCVSRPLTDVTLEPDD
ncbi:MAG: ferredoxin--NADP reductase [Polyangiaceae bacterium]|nr:ferredoxin--NADP reductase [Polyangiaceae bacterium]